MRNNTPFDPRIQQMGMYMNNPSPQVPQMYMQPMMQAPISGQQNFLQMTSLTQNNQIPQYTVGSTMQQTTQQIITSEQIKPTKQ